MKIIFLDIDGVLNSEYSRKINEDAWYHPSDMPCRILISNLNIITRKTGAKIVMSSSWRNSATFWMFGYFLKSLGLDDYKSIIDKTPNIHLSYVERGKEIKSWLSMNSFRNIESFVILDDESDMCDIKKQLVQTNPEIGLTIGDANKAIKILNKE